MKEALIESRFGWGIAEGFPGFFSQLSGLFFGFYSGLGRQFRSFLEGQFSLGTGRCGTGLGLGSELLEGIGAGCLDSLGRLAMGGGFGGPAGFAWLRERFPGLMPPPRPPLVGYVLPHP
ncbi:MAG: hypothetical protein CAK90_03095 [Spartobacteria bacterium AMD-G4]|nr:MAG: hypothetical protein CAK90_03095 [Spartobacteria bacterium AMD-G4]